MASRGEIDDMYCCPITQDVMKDPVVDREGNSYERAAIENWLETHDTSPVTRSKLTLADLTPNRALQQIIQKMTGGGNASAASVDSKEGKEGKEGKQAVSSDEPVTVSVVTTAAGQDGITGLVSLNVPPAAKRTACDVVCVVDVSGSMSMEATMQNATGQTEGNGLNLLDIVKHAVRTVARTLGPDDRLGIVSYSTSATTVLGMTKMDDAGQQSAVTVLKGLYPGGQTNIWDGLHKAMELLKAGTGGRVASILLLTDGQPNIEPPRGHLPALRNYKDKNTHFECSISTFGFGYNLDSGLLKDLANEGHGAYAFIPDSSFVGTVFVHAVSNTLTSVTTSTVVSLEALNGASVIEGGVLPDGHMQVQPASWGVQIGLGTLTCGQSRDLVVKLATPAGASGPFLRATLKYKPRHSSSQAVVEAESVNASASAATDAEVQNLRCSFIATVSAAMNFASCGQLAEAQEAVNALVVKIQRSPAASDRRVAEMLKDVTGQVRQAVSRADWFQKWGRHYLPSLARAHALQQCNNFKDPGVQLYGGALFAEIRDEADEIFNTIPPPEPAAPSYGGYGFGGHGGGRAAAAAAPRVINMAAYNNAAGPCFGGQSQVLMADGSLKDVRDVRRGDVVQSPEQGNGAEVACVVKTLCESGEHDLVRLKKGLLVTPWHPVRIGGVWHFPCSLAEVERRPCPAVYSFVLADGSEPVMVINDVECVTLGHSFKGEVVGHAYFGSRRVVDDLQQMSGWEEGLVELRTGTCLVRDADTQQVVRLKQ